MVDGPTAGVIIAAIITSGAALIVGMMQFGPRRKSDSQDPESCEPDLGSRVAVLEANHTNLGRSFDEFRRELHQIRDMLIDLGAKQPRKQ